MTKPPASVTSVENTYWGVYRLWSRPRRVTKRCITK